MLSSQNAKDVELLISDPKRFEEILISALQPTGRVEQIQRSLVVGIAEFSLFDFFFDFHSVKKNGELKLPILISCWIKLAC